MSLPRPTGLKAPSKIGRPSTGGTAPRTSGIPAPSSGPSSRAQSALAKSARAAGLSAAQAERYVAENLNQLGGPEPSSSSGNSTDDLKIGDRVFVGGTKAGVIAFIGEAQFAPGEWAGVALDEPIGKNDGSVAGVRYFQCEPMKGVFSRLSKLSRTPGSVPVVAAPKSTDSTGEPRSITPQNTGAPNGTLNHTPARSQTPRIGLAASKVKSTSNASLNKESPPTSTTNLHRGGLAMTKSKVKVGDRVVVSGTKTGVLRYVGQTDFAKGEWAGVELDDPQGKNDGAVAGKRYFDCRPNYGLFAPMHKVARYGGGATPSPQSRSLANTSLRSARERSGSQESISSVSSTASSVSRSRASKSGQRPSTLNLTATTSALQKALKEKEEHIEQLLRERDLERAEVARAAAHVDEAETELTMIRQDKERLFVDSEDQLKQLRALVLELEKDKKDLSLKLEDEKRKVEDLQFQIEEEVISKDDLECQTEADEAKLRDVERNYKREKERADKLQQEMVALKDIVSTQQKKLKESDDTQTTYLDQMEELTYKLNQAENKVKTFESSKLEDGAKTSQLSLDLEERASRVHELEETLSAQRKEIKDLQEKLGEVKDELTDTNNKKQKMQDNITDLTNKLQANEKSQNKLSDEVRTLRTKGSDLQHQLSTSKSKVEELTEDRNKVEAQLSELMKNSGDSSKQLSLMNQQVAEKNRKIEELQSDLSSSTHKVASLNESIEQLKVDSDKEREDIVNKTREEVKEAEGRLEDVQTELDRTKNKVSKLSEDFEKERQELEGKKDLEITDLKKQLSSNAEELEKQELQTQAHKQVLDKITLEKEAMKCRKNGFIKESEMPPVTHMWTKHSRGDYFPLGNVEIIGANYYTGRKKKRKLSRSHLAIDADEGRKVTKAVKNNCWLPRLSLEEWYPMKRHKYRQITNQKVDLPLFEKEKAEKNLKRIESEKDAINSELIQARVGVSKLETEIQQNTQSKQSMEEQIQVAQEERDRAQKSKQDIQKQLEEVRTEKDKVITEKNQMQQDAMTSKADLQAKDMQVEELRKEVEKLKADTKSQQEELMQKSQSEVDSSALSQNLEDIKSQLSQAQSKLREAEAEKLKLKAEVEQSQLVKEDRKKLEDQTKQLQSELQAADKRYREAKADLETATSDLKSKADNSHKQLQKQEEELGEYKKKVGELERENTSLSGLKASLASLEKDREKERNQLLDKIHSLEARVKETQNNSNNIETTGDPALARLKSDKEAADGQIDFLNSVIVDMQRKNEEMKLRLQAMEAGIYDNGDAVEGMDISPSRSVAAPRLFCDICDMFDLHDTDDCPKQAMSESPPATRHHGDRHQKRLYCEICEDDERYVEGVSDPESMDSPRSAPLIRVVDETNTSLWKSQDDWKRKETQRRVSKKGYAEAGTAKEDTKGAAMEESMGRGTDEDLHGLLGASAWDSDDCDAEVAGMGLVRSDEMLKMTMSVTSEEDELRVFEELEASISLEYGEELKDTEALTGDIPEDESLIKPFENLVGDTDSYDVPKGTDRLESLGFSIGKNEEGLMEEDGLFIDTHHGEHDDKEIKGQGPQTADEDISQNIVQSQNMCPESSSLRGDKPVSSHKEEVTRSAPLEDLGSEVHPAVVKESPVTLDDGLPDNSTDAFGVIPDINSQSEPFSNESNVTDGCQFESESSNSDHKKMNTEAIAGNGSQNIIPNSTEANTTDGVINFGPGNVLWSKSQDEDNGQENHGAASNHGIEFLLSRPVENVPVQQDEQADRKSLSDEFETPPSGTSPCITPPSGSSPASTPPRGPTPAAACQTDQESPSGQSTDASDVTRRQVKGRSWSGFDANEFEEQKPNGNGKTDSCTIS